MVPPQLSRITHSRTGVGAVPAAGGRAIFRNASVSRPDSRSSAGLAVPRGRSGKPFAEAGSTHPGFVGAAVAGAEPAGCAGVLFCFLVLVVGCGWFVFVPAARFFFVGF